MHWQKVRQQISDTKFCPLSKTKGRAIAAISSNTKMLARTFDDLFLTRKITGKIIASNMTASLKIATYIIFVPSILLSDINPPKRKSKDNGQIAMTEATMVRIDPTRSDLEFCCCVVMDDP